MYDDTPMNAKPVDPRFSLLGAIEEHERELSDLRHRQDTLHKELAEVEARLEKVTNINRSAAHELIGRLREVTGETCEGQKAPTYGDIHISAGAGR